MNDSQIIDALQNGWHLSDKELDRACIMTLQILLELNKRQHVERIAPQAMRLSMQIREAHKEAKKRAKRGAGA